MISRRTFGLSAASSAASLLALTAPPATADEKKPATSAKKPRVLVTISKETTYITEPLRPDGYPDYIAALNQRFSQGVTPENNAAVPLVRALGLDARSMLVVPPDLEHYRKRFFQLLRVPELDDHEQHLVDFGKYSSESVDEKRAEDEETEGNNQTFREIKGTVTERPWTRKEFPLVARWLDHSSNHLELVAHAAIRPRYYAPCLSEQDDGLVFSVLLPLTQSSRSAAQALCARAMLSIREGKTEDAVDDLLICHRLASLIGQSPFLVDGLVSFTIDAMVSKAHQCLLKRDELSSVEIVKIRRHLEQPRPIASMADRIDIAERFVYLDAVLAFARNGIEVFGTVLDGKSQTFSVLDSWLDTILMQVDWDGVLRAGNAWYDRLVAAARAPTRVEKRKAIDKCDKDIHELSMRCRSFGWFSVSLLGEPRKVISDRIGELWLSLLSPTLLAACNAEDRWSMQCELTKLAFALAQCRIEQGVYPQKLSELVPRYVRTVPKDIFNDSDLQYRRDGNGYVLYSVGPNGKDDGGRTMEDRYKSEEPNADWDDLVVRMPGN